MAVDFIFSDRADILEKMLPLQILGGLTSYGLLILAILLLLQIRRKQISFDKSVASGLPSPAALLPPPPGPKPWPILGSLHLMADSEKIPFEAFSKLRRIYGDIFSIRLGSTDCVVVNGTDLTKEVLSKKAQHFTERPNFVRFEALFGGDKNNSLAFCDYSVAQEVRRRLIKSHSIPRAYSTNWDRLDLINQEESERFLTEIFNQDNPDREWTKIDIKPVLAKSCANIFIRYFCSLPSFSYSNESFSNFVSDFDKIFWEVNNGRAMDFLPWLYPFMIPILKDVNVRAHNIREFVEKNILAPKVVSKNDVDFLDSFINYMENDNTQEGNPLTRDMLVFALEDILGGHCAVTNVLLRILKDLSDHPEVQKDLLKDIERTSSLEDPLVFKDTRNLPLLNACVYETIRLTCSPIIPHKSNRDTSIGEYFIKKDTVVFVNNHHLNYSSSLWSNPEEYDPKRFISKQGSLLLPSYFQPFSVGRRSCMGYKITQLLCANFTAEILRHFELSPSPQNKDLKLGMLASEPGAFEFSVRRRCKDSYT